MRRIGPKVESEEVMLTDTLKLSERQEPLVKNVRVDTVSVDPPSIAAGVTTAFTVTLTCAATDKIILIPPNTIEEHLVFVGAAVTAENTITIKIYNKHTAAVDGAPLDWAYLLFAP